MSRTKFSTYSSAGEPTSSSGRAELHDRAVAHDRDAVSEPQRLRQVVGDEDHRLARLVLQADHLVLHVAANERVECAERLVVEHHLRLDGERAGEADALLHAAGELVGELVGGVLEPDEAEDLLGALEPLRLRDALDLEPERDVVDHAAVGEQPEVLEDHRRRVPAQLAQLRLARGRHVLAGDLDPTGGRLDQADQRAHERRLPGAREPHHDEHLARPDVERDVANGGDAVVLLAQLGAGEVGVGRADHPVGVAAEDLPDALRADQRIAAAIDLVPGGDGGVGHRCHRSTLPRLSVETKVKRAPPSCRRRRCRR